MLGKAIFCLWIMIAVLVFTPMQHVNAADFNMHLHLYTADEVTIGEISFGEQVAFRLQVTKDGAMPVISMHKGNVGAVIAPEIINGMFMLRFNDER